MPIKVNINEIKYFASENEMISASASDNILEELMKLRMLSNSWSFFKANKREDLDTVIS